MSEINRRLWPFGPRLGLISSAALLIVLILIAAGLHATFGWPSAQAEGAVLISILVLSLMPIVLTLLDVIIDRGAVVEYRGIKVDFSQSRQAASPAFVVPPNIGVPGQPLTDSDTAQILDTLGYSTTCPVIVIDLEGGNAWWETRLLVLLAGANRLGRPERVVFLGTDAGKERQFQGWAKVDELLHLLVAANKQYSESLSQTRAAARQWELIEPVAAAQQVQPMIMGPLANKYSWMSFDPVTGRRNDLMAEQMLQAELGQKIETQGGSRKVTLIRLEELFRPVLNTDRIDLTWTSERQTQALLETDATHLAITRHGQYLALVSQAALLTEAVKPLLLPRRRE